MASLCGDRSQHDLLQLQERLQSAVDGCLQDRELTEEQRQQLLSATERIWRQLQHALQSRSVGTPHARNQGAPSYLLQSPVYRPLSPAPADVEIQKLEEQVNLAAQHAAARRQTAPGKLKEIYALKLAQLRPSTDALQADRATQTAGAGSGEGDENAGEGRDAPLAYSPNPLQLKEKLAHAGSKLPILRARLEEASDRVQRVFAVLSTELNRPPPNTVERAVLGKTPGGPAGNPACEQAVETGMLSTRRRLGKDVQPVPLEMPAELE